MARVVSLHLYPIKSCAAWTLDAATLGVAGLESDGIGDREWMIVTPAGQFLTQREYPRMALIRSSVQTWVQTGAATAVPDAVQGAMPSEAGRKALVGAAPGMPDLQVPIDAFALRSADRHVTVWNHACDAFDEGDAAAAWLSDFLHAKARLVRFDPAHKRLSNRQRTGTVEAQNRFSDGYPLLTLSTASLDKLNERLQEAGREAIPINRFRPNIVIDDVGPHDEDRVTELHGASYTLRAVKPCPRCPIPSINQATGERGQDPLDILSQYRGGPEGVLFGQNMITLAGFGARIATGDRLDEEWTF